MMTATRILILSLVVSREPSPVWCQSPPGLLQPGTYNAPAGAGAAAPASPSGTVTMPSIPSAQPTPAFNQEILNPPPGALIQSFWLQGQTTPRHIPSSNWTGTTIFRVKMPSPSAQLWVNGQLTHQTGLERVFVTPPLGAGNYRYHLRASWEESASRDQNARTVIFQPGTEVRVDFTSKHPSAL